MSTMQKRPRQQKIDGGPTCFAAPKLITAEERHLLLRADPSTSTVDASDLDF